MQDADRSYLFILPNELLAAIASELLVTQHGYVVDAYHLAVFSLTCRRVYLSTRSVLFNHVPLASEAQIESLSLVPERLLKCIHHLTLYLDPPFIQAWRIEGDSVDLTAGGRFEGPAIFITFARLLSQASRLRSVSFKVAESFGPGSVWRKFEATRLSALSLAPMKDAFATLSSSLSHDFALVNLTSLRVDAFEGLGPLLRMCPNLRELNIFNSGGFDTTATERLMECLPYVPQLRSLSFTPSTIASYRREHNSAWLMKAIGKNLPLLEKLSLQTRWLGYGAFLVPMKVEVEDLIGAISALPNLTHLYLPVSLQSDDEIPLFQERRHHPPSIGPAGSLRALLKNQRNLALQRVEERELEAIREMQEKAPQLRTVSWVRFANIPPGHRLQSCSNAEVSVEYHFDDITTADQAISPTPGITRPSNESSRPPRRRINISIHDAEESFEDARPTYMWTTHPQVLRIASSKPLSVNRTVMSAVAVINDVAHALFMVAFIIAFLTVIMQQLGP